MIQVTVLVRLRSCLVIHMALVSQREVKTGYFWVKDRGNKKDAG